MAKKSAPNPGTTQSHGITNKVIDQLKQSNAAIQKKFHHQKIFYPAATARESLKSAASSR